MKCIIKALQETEYKPRPKWWGFVRDSKRYLCRYNHVMCVFKGKELLYSFSETRTDKAGVQFAINYMQK